MSVLQLSFPGNGDCITSDSDESDDDATEAVGGGLKLTKQELALAIHDAKFTPPIYNIWKQQEKSSEVENPRGACQYAARADSATQGTRLKGDAAQRGELCVYAAPLERIAALKSASAQP